MTKKKSTKRALISSLLILAMCFTMLAGTTFAWFTDSVTSTGNIIKSGKLDVSLKWADGKEDPAAATWKDASTGAIFNYDLWEPGYVEVRHIQIKNEGNLALKYKVQISANGEVSALADVIDVYYMDPAVQVANRAALAAATPMATLKDALAGMATTASGELVPVGKEGNGLKSSETITIALKMRETAGNEYQNLSIGTDFSIQLLATQYTYEPDSFDDQYDAAAEFPVASQGEFETALAAAAQSTEPATVVLSAGDYTIPAGTTIENLTIEGKEGTVVDTINISSGANTTLKNFTAEGVTFESSHGDTWKGILSTPTTLEDATFKNCTFSTEGEARKNNIYDARMKGDVVFDECTIYGDVYGINFGHVDGTLTIKNSEVTGWNSFGGATVAGDPSKVVIENCNFHQSDYNKLRFYQNAEVKNCTFDTEFFDPSVSQVYGSFEGGIDAATSGISVTLTGCKIKNVGTGALTNLYDNYVGYVKNCTGISNVTWIIDGNNVSANVPGNSTI